jgi:hypothetical protein
MQVAGQMLGDMADAFSTASNWVKVVGAGITIGGFIQPELVPVGVSIFEFGAGMDTAGSTAKMTSHGLKGEGKEALIEGLGIVAGHQAGRGVKSLGGGKNGRKYI